MPRHGTNDLLLQFLFWLPCVHMRADCRQIATRDPVDGFPPERLEDPMLAIRHADRPAHYGKLRGAMPDVLDSLKNKGRGGQAEGLPRPRPMQ